MKIFAKIISIYFLILIALPAIKMVAMQFEGNCCEATHKCSSENSKGCQKEKCILSFNFNTSQFIIQQIHHISYNHEPEFEQKDNLAYEKVFIAKYQSTIWHPPKTILVS
jgi:hypothetical protein